MRTPFYRHRIVRSFAIALAILPLFEQVAYADQTIGDAQIVVNDVRGTVGKSDPAVLRAGIDVFQNEVIRTGDRSASRVLFQDKTSLSIGAGSEVTLDRFVFDPDPSKSQVALSIARGVVRFTTGGLPKSAYRITTPTATIGVRGTIITITVAADGTTTVSVIDGVAVVTAGGQTVTVDAGMSTTTAPGSPPTPPFTTPPAPPAPVSEMDYLLADNTLPPGAPAGEGVARTIRLPIIAAGVGVLVVGIILLTNSNGHSGNTTTSTATQ